MIVHSLYPIYLEYLCVCGVCAAPSVPQVRAASVGAPQEPGIASF